jgi:hypothetical protein
MPGGVGRGREKLPLTRLDKKFTPPSFSFLLAYPTITLNSTLRFDLDSSPVKCQDIVDKPIKTRSSIDWKSWSLTDKNFQHADELKVIELLMLNMKRRT